jgi:ribosome-binding ATPase
MSLSIGIVGLPNVGKSTLFNALLKRQAALAANYPFATIEPNVGVVEVPDERLNKIAEIVRAENGGSLEIPEKITPAAIKFYDIAGLIKGAAEGQGLGNQFLSHIREVDAILHVVRAFEDESVVREGSVSPREDINTVNTELILADLTTLQKRIEKHQKLMRGDDGKENKQKELYYLKLLKLLNEGKFGSELFSGMAEEESGEARRLVKDLNLLTFKPVILAFNVSENNFGNFKIDPSTYGFMDSVVISARIEFELSTLSGEDQITYISDLGIKESGLDKIIKTSYKILNLETFFTAGITEVRAWTIEKGTKAPQAGGVIHTDFERGFIKAETVSFEDFIRTSGFRGAKETGVLRLEGKNYTVRDGDIITFRFNV